VTSCVNSIDYLLHFGFKSRSTTAYTTHSPRHNNLPCAPTHAPITPTQDRHSNTNAPKRALSRQPAPNRIPSPQTCVSDLRSRPSLTHLAIPAPLSQRRTWASMHLLRPLHQIMTMPRRERHCRPVKSLGIGYARYAGIFVSHSVVVLGCVAWVSVLRRSVLCLGMVYIASNGLCKTKGDPRLLEESLVWYPQLSETESYYR